MNRFMNCLRRFVAVPLLAALAVLALAAVVIASALFVAAGLCAVACVAAAGLVIAFGVGSAAILALAVGLVVGVDPFDLNQWEGKPACQKPSSAD